MTKREWNEGLNCIDSELVEEYVEHKERVERRRRTKSIWLNIGAAAACILLVIGTLSSPWIMNNIGRLTHKRIINKQTPSSAPTFVGSETVPTGSEESHYSDGISVTAKYIEALPDKYTFFGDWNQIEYRIVRFDTVKLLNGIEMTDEFYYLIPSAYMTDYYKYSKFVLLNMAQYGYENTVVYNKSQGKAESLKLVLFGAARKYQYTVFGSTFIAYDSMGNLDKSLWKTTEAWKQFAELVSMYDIMPKTLSEAEKLASKDPERYSLNVRSLKDISGEAKEMLEYITSFENGIYVTPFSNGLLYRYPEVNLQAFKYINGFPTNESVSIWSKEYTGVKDTFKHSKARFNEEDLKKLPELASAVAAVAAAYDAGELKPVNSEFEELEQISYGIFGWYAKTDDGVIGVIRVTRKDRHSGFDDTYYIIEYGDSKYTPISREALIERLGEYEKDYIYYTDELFDAEEASAVFDGYYSRKTTVYLPAGTPLQLEPIPTDEYLDIYTVKSAAKELSKEELNEFAERILPKLTFSFGIKGAMETKESDLTPNSSQITKSYSSEEDDYTFRFVQSSIGEHPNTNSIEIINRGDRTWLDGKLMQLNFTQTDEEMLESLEWVKEKLFDIFGCEFEAARVEKHYSVGYSQPKITIYYYNDTGKEYEGDYVCIGFSKPSQNFSISYQCAITYYTHRIPLDEMYTVEGSYKRISIEEATELLEKGYIFGPHNCPKCMEDSDTLNYVKYDFAELKYFRYSYDSTLKDIPVYAFYKKINNTNKNYDVYRVYYVCAMKVYGLEEYFYAQGAEHPED